MTYSSTSLLVNMARYMCVSRCLDDESEEDDPKVQDKVLRKREVAGTDQGRYIHIPGHICH